MIRPSFAAAIAFAALAIGFGCTDDPPPKECADFNPRTLTISLIADPGIDASPASNGWLIPLEVSVDSSSDCFIGVAHATVTASGGQFSSATASAPGNKNSSASTTSDGGDAAAPATSAGDASAATQGASTTVTLSPTDHHSLIGFATLLLASGQLSSEVQITVGDSSTCVLIDASGTSVRVGASGSCGARQN